MDLLIITLYLSLLGIIQKKNRNKTGLPIRIRLNYEITAYNYIFTVHI